MSADVEVEVDVVIAGAGPAGIATAVALLRREGLAPGRVVCLDKARFPRAKPCGGGLTGHAAAAMNALGLSLRVPSVACHEGSVGFGAHERVVDLERPVHIIRREDFDADLVAQARALGVTIREGEGVASFAVETARRRVQVRTTTGRTLYARVLVGADGAGSAVRKALLTKWPRAPRQPLRLARLEMPAPRDLGHRMVYDFSPFSDGLRGYVWLFPVPGGRVNVGVMHSPEDASAPLGGRALDAVLGRALARHGLTLPGPARGWPAWAYHPDAPIAGPHLLCVGDAAGIDALTGEGIAVALEYGPIAARAIGEALKTGDHRFLGYRKAIRRATVGRELALDRHMAGLLYGSSNHRRWLSLILFDEAMRRLYAARVCGSAVLADRKGTLLAALGRHLVLGRQRQAALSGET